MTWPKLVFASATVLLTALIIAFAFRYSAPVFAGSDTAFVTDHWTGKASFKWTDFPKDGRGKAGVVSIPQRDFTTEERVSLGLATLKRTSSDAFLDAPDQPKRTP